MAADKWTVTATIASAVSALAATASIYLTVRYGHEQASITRQATLQQSLKAYTTQYQDILSKHPEGPSSIKNYVRLGGADRSAVQIVAGLLVQVVDEMYESKDPRWKAWSTYFASFPGPLFCGYPLENYAMEPATRTAIQAAVKSAKSEGYADHLSPASCGGP